MIDPLEIVILAVAISAAILAAWQLHRTARSSEHPKAISFQSICPACGHRGCKLKFMPPPVIVADEKKGIVNVKVEDAKVMRICDHCGASCYEATVLPPEKWIAK